MVKRSKIRPAEATPPSPTTISVHVLYSQSTTGGGRTSDDPYSTRVDKHTTTTFKGAVIGDDPDNPGYGSHWQCMTFSAPKEAFDEPRSHVYAVVGYYSDGDTFGHSYGNLHIAEVYGNINKAYAVAQCLRSENQASQESIFGSHRFPWGGYFARLERVEVEVLPVLGRMVNPADTRDPNDIPSW